MEVQEEAAMQRSQRWEGSAGRGNCLSKGPGVGLHMLGLRKEAGVAEGRCSEEKAEGKSGK